MISTDAIAIGRYAVGPGANAVRLAQTEKHLGANATAAGANAKASSATAIFPRF